MSKGRWIAVILIFGFAALTLGPQGPAGGFWGAATAEEMGIEGGLNGAFFGYGIIEALAFGAGVAWLAFGRSAARRAGATAAFLAVGWALVSWWPHGSFHQAIGEDNPQALILLEYSFHATMIIAAAVIARYLWRSFTATRDTPVSAAAAH